jgi:hypothetical protein
MLLIERDSVATPLPRGRLDRAPTIAITHSSALKPRL